MCVIKRKLKFENDKKCLEATQFANKINYLEKKINIYNFKNDHKELITNDKLKLKTAKI